MITDPKKPQEEHDPITAPEEVPESNDEKIDEDFPGYPHYPAKDDLLNPDNDTERVDVDVENITRSIQTIRLQEKNHAQRPNEGPAEMNAPDNDDLGIVAGTEADLNEDDFLILESVDGIIGRHKEDEIATTDSLNDIDGNDMDMPGTELDDANEAIGEEDEENNFYSLGADREDLLESRED